MMTRAGVILGTAAYMSPEQAKGRAVDKRADIWAFGCVLFEMLAGRPVFGGDTVTETLAAVMRDEPRLDELPPDDAACRPDAPVALPRARPKAPAPRHRRGAHRPGRGGRIVERRSRAPRRRRRRVPDGSRCALAPWIVAAASLAAAGFFAAGRPFQRARPRVWSSRSPRRPIRSFCFDTNLGQRVAIAGWHQDRVSRREPDARVAVDPIAGARRCQAFGRH